MFGLLLGGQSAAEGDLRERLTALADIFLRGLAA
jgi:hypothetical protein